jgi:serine/threonine protein kinase
MLTHAVDYCNHYCYFYYDQQAVTAGEMWSVVYEALTGYPEGRLPIEHGVFYASCILEALAYMHGRGIAYRDLKPENIMMDAQVSCCCCMFLLIHRILVLALAEFIRRACGST